MAENTYNTKVARFRKIMLEKLRENSCKDGWQDCSWQHLCSRMRQEAWELQDEIEHAKARGTLDSEKTIRKIGREAADIANFAMMVADNLGALKNGEKL